MSKKKFLKLSVIIPCFNEKKTIEKILNKILLSLKTNNLQDYEIIIVDDCSKDGSREILKSKLENNNNIQVYFHNRNKGKGAAIKTAKKYITGDIVIIQDADLEYDPYDYAKLILPIINNEYKVVYGSRVLNKKRYNVKGFSSKFRIFANHILTIISNFLNDQKLTDAHTCYKIFDKKIFDQIELEEDDFCFCPEVTSKISKLGLKIFEVPINYNGRKYSEGKKISTIDGFKALKALIKYS